LVDDPVLVDDERHDARIPVFCRERYQRKSADHMPVSDIVVSAAWGVLTLARQDAIEIAVIRRVLALVGRRGIALRPRVRNQRPDRTLRLPGRAFPEEAIMLAWATEELLRIFQNVVAAM